MRDNNTRAHSSSRGMLVSLSGATLVFAINIVTAASPVEWTTRKYTTAAYVLEDASANPCNSTPNTVGEYRLHRGIERVFSTGNCS